MRHPHLLDALHLIKDGVVRLGTSRFNRQYLRVLGSPAERLERIRAAVEGLAKTAGGCGYSAAPPTSHSCVNGSACRNCAGGGLPMRLRQWLMPGLQS